MPLTPENIKAVTTLANISEEDYNVVSQAVKSAVDGLRSLLK